MNTIMAFEDPDYGNIMESFKDVTDAIIQQRQNPGLWRSGLLPFKKRPKTVSHGERNSK